MFRRARARGGGGFDGACARRTTRRAILGAVVADGSHTSSCFTTRALLDKIRTCGAFTFFTERVTARSRPALFDGRRLSTDDAYYGLDVFSNASR